MPMGLMCMPSMRLDVEPRIVAAPPAGGALLLEDGVFYILLEDGSKILLES